MKTHTFLFSEALILAEFCFLAPFLFILCPSSIKPVRSYSNFAKASPPLLPPAQEVETNIVL